MSRYHSNDGVMLHLYASATHSVHLRLAIHPTQRAAYRVQRHCVSQLGLAWLGWLGGRSRTKLSDNFHDACCCGMAMQHCHT
jgi:hypothetical protein